LSGKGGGGKAFSKTLSAKEARKDQASVRKSPRLLSKERQARD